MSTAGCLPGEGIGKTSSITGCPLLVKVGAAVIVFLPLGHTKQRGRHVSTDGNPENQAAAGPAHPLRVREALIAESDSMCASAVSAISVSVSRLAAAMSRVEKGDVGKLREEVLALLGPDPRALPDAQGKPRVSLVYNARDKADFKNAALISHHSLKRRALRHPDDPAQHSPPHLLRRAPRREFWGIVQTSRRRHARALPVRPGRPEDRSRPCDRSKERDWWLCQFNVFDEDEATILLRGYDVVGSIVIDQVPSNSATTSRRRAPSGRLAGSSTWPSHSLRMAVARVKLAAAILPSWTTDKTLAESDSCQQPARVGIGCLDQEGDGSPSPHSAVRILIVPPPWAAPQAAVKDLNFFSRVLMVTKCAGVYAFGSIGD